MVSKLALGAIWGYQRYISPYKGFRCAHSVLHGGTGCSGFAKHAIIESGFWGAIPDIRQRFRDCRSASETLRAACPVHSQRADDDEDDKNRKKRRQRSDDACDCYEGVAAGCLGGSLCAGTSASSQPTEPPSGGGTDGGNCLPGDCSMPDCGSCDCAPSCN